LRAGPSAAEHAPGTEGEPAALLEQLNAHIGAGDQQGAGRTTRRYLELHHPVEPLLQSLLRWSITSDGALHAEKYFHTTWDEYHATRATLRDAHVVGLARVVASEAAFPAPGVEEATRLLGG